MFAFNLLNVLTNLLPNTTKIKNYSPHSPREIRKMIQHLSRCPNCQFLIFDNYWTNDVEKKELKVCPTCGYKI